MTKDTMQFIFALKHNSNIFADHKATLREIAVHYMSELTLCPKEAYTESALFGIVKGYFLDFLSTADHPERILRRFFEMKERDANYKEVTGRDFGNTDTDYLLSCLMLAQVKDGEKYINGFTDEYFNKGESNGSI